MFIIEMVIDKIIAAQIRYVLLANILHGVMAPGLSAPGQALSGSLSLSLE